MIGEIIARIKSDPKLKKLFIFMMASPFTARPRLWIRILVNPFFHKTWGRVRSTVRLDLFPYNRCEIGKHSFVEDFCTLNNGVGDVIVGKTSRVGLGCTVIGPVFIGDNVQIAQNVVMSGMNHNYEDISKTINEQGVNKTPIVIEHDVWIGANSVITAGVHIGTHSVVAAGSVVTKSIPPYMVWAGTPAKPIKSYDFEKKEWMKVSDNTNKQWI